MNLIKKAIKDKKELTILQFVYRIVAVTFAEILKHTPVTPNFVTVISFIVGLLAAFYFGKASYFCGIMLAQAAVLLDFMDGALARAKNMSSKIGQWLELVLGDRIADCLVVMGIALGMQKPDYNQTAWILAFLFVLGRLFLNAVNDYTSYHPFFVEMRKQMDKSMVYESKGVFSFLRRQLIYTRVNHYLLLTLAVIFNKLIWFLVVINIYVWLFCIALIGLFTYKVYKLK